MEEKFTLQEGEEYIELIKLLKFMDIAATGGEAKLMVDDGEVKVNGAIENRRRNKIRKGDRIEIFDRVISVISA